MVEERSFDEIRTIPNVESVLLLVLPSVDLMIQCHTVIIRIRQMFVDVQFLDLSCYGWETGWNSLSIFVLISRRKKPGGRWEDDGERAVNSPKLFI